jgi:hypothetical protein
MNKTPKTPSLCEQPVVFDTPAAETIVVRKDLEFVGADETMRLRDVYSRPALSAMPRPAVIMVAGYPDPGFQRVVGCLFKEMRHITSWGSLLAACGLTAISYSNREPIADLQALLNALASNAGVWNVDVERVAVWTTSGNVPTALTSLTKKVPFPIRCATLLYGYMIDAPASTAVEDAAKTFHFADPGMTFDDLRWDVPMFVARAGRDECPQLNETIDRFVAEALRRSLPLTLINHSQASHAFDLFDNSELSRHVVRQAIAFLQLQLDTSSRSGPTSSENRPKLPLPASRPC